MTAYTFSLAATSLLYFDSLTNNANLRWSLSGPIGTPVSNRTFTASDAAGISGSPALALPAGDYTLTVSASGSNTGAYSFRLLDLSQATPLTPGTPVSGTFSPANGTTAYRFTASAGDSDYFARLSGSSSDYWRLIDPYGHLLFGTDLSTDGGRLTLTATGTYTVLAEAGVADTTAASYSFNVAPVTDPTQPLVVGATISASLGGAVGAGPVHLHPGGSLPAYFDSLTNNSNLRWSLSGPVGTPVSNRTFTSSDASSISGNPVLSLPAGAYTLTVSGVGGDHRRLLLPAARPLPGDGA